MGLHRMLPPASGPTTITVNGRLYSCAIGSSIDVPDMDGLAMSANGWMYAASGGAGTTSQRPMLTKNQAGTQFHDSALAYNITWDGKTWRNPTSGAAV